MTIPIKVELFVGGSWTDITSDVHRPGRIRITRQRPAARSGVVYSRCSLTLNDPTGKYSNRNPASPYYGQLARNTPIRVRMDHPVVAAPTYRSATSIATGTTGSFTLAKPAGTVRGDVLLAFHRCDTGAVADMSISGGSPWTLLLDDEAKQQRVYWKYAGAVEPASYSFTQDTNADGNAAIVCVQTTYPVDIELASAAASVSGTALPTPPVIPARSTALEVRWVTGDPPDALTTFTPPAGTTERADVNSGGFLAGSVATRTLSSGGSSGTLNFTASAAFAAQEILGITVAVSASATRFAGEVPEWPARWSVSGRDLRFSIEAAGISRRLGQGAKAVQSPLLRHFTDSPLAGAIAGYWSMEETEPQSRRAAASIGIQPLQVAGKVAWAQNRDIPGSAPLPVLGTGSVLTGPIEGGVDTSTTLCASLVFSIPDGGLPAAPVPILDIFTTGTAQKWSLFYMTGGTLELQAFRVDTSTYTLVGAVSGTALGSLDGKRGQIEIRAIQVGADVLASVILRLLSDDGRPFTATSVSDTFTSVTSGTATSLILGQSGSLDGAAVGHLAIANDNAALSIWSDIMGGWVDERVADRVQRVCRETRVPVTVLAPEATAPCGQQATGSLPDICQDAATADQGALYEDRAVAGLKFRSNGALLNQTPMQLRYGILSAFEPVDDDQAIENDITVSRPGGSRYRATQPTGPLSTQEPPDGVGTYDRGARTVNVGGDGQLPDVARWLLRLGTWDEPRYPTVRINLHKPSIAADTALTAAVAALDLTDVVRITGLPPWMPPGDLDVMIQGYTETLGPREWTIDWAMTPAGPYRVGVYGTDRYSPSDSTLNSSATTTGTSLSVAFAGLRWVTGAVSIPIVIGGEVMTVTNISGTTSPQTFTVTRSVNGVVKTHPADAEVRLLTPVAGAYGGGSATLATGATARATDMPRSTGISVQAAPGGADLNSFGGGQFMAGPGAVTELAFTKHRDDTNVRLLLSTSRYDANSGNNVATYSVHIAGSEYAMLMHFVNSTLDHQFGMAVRQISGLAAGSYVIRGYWTRSSGAGEMRRDLYDWLTIHAMEVFPG